MSISLSKPRWRKRVMSIFLLLLLIYIAYAGILFFFQHSLIFPRSIANYSPPIAPPTGVVVLDVEPEPGVQIQAWLLTPRSASPNNTAPCVIYFHGNAERIDHNSRTIQMYRDLGCAVLMPEYRGYGNSTGSPSQSSIAGDMRLYREMLQAMPEIDQNRIIYHARSIGSGVAMELARTHPPAAIILDAPFKSLVSMTNRYLIPPFLCRSPFRNDSVIKKLDGPILIHHGSHDRIIPQSHGRTLATLAQHATFVSLDCGHNDLPNDPQAYADGIQSFLEEHKMLNHPH